MKKIDIINKVKEILNYCKVSQAPIPIIEIAHKYGFVVVEKIMDDDESGFMIISKKGISLGDETVKKIIVINTAETPYRKRFTIAHELGHYFLEYEGIEDSLSEDVIVHREQNAVAPDKEREADKFAGELLIPTNLLEIEMSKLINIELIFSDIPEVISKKFGVSYTAAKVRLDIFARRRHAN